MRSALLILTAIILFAAPGPAQGQAPPQGAFEIKPAEISLGAASPKKPSSGSFTIQRASGVQTRWTMKGPAGWTAPPDQKQEGTIGPDPLAFRVSLRAPGIIEIPGNTISEVPVELVIESSAGKMVFSKILAPGRYRERLFFTLEGEEQKQLNMYFRVLKDEEPVLLVDAFGIDFGNIESGSSTSKTIHIRNPGRKLLSWDIRRSGLTARSGRYMSLASPAVRSGEPYTPPAHLANLVNFQGDWTGVDGYPLGKSGSSLQVNFTGTGIVVHGAKDSDAGQIVLNLDGQPAGETACGSGYMEVTEIASLEGLAEGPHTLTIAKKGGVLYIEGIQVVGGMYAIAPAGWLKIFPDDGTTQSETDFVNVSINTAGLAPGIYCDEIVIEANSGRLNIPVAANVTISAVPQILRIYRFTRGRDVLYSCNPQDENPRKLSGYTNKTLVFRLYRDDTPGTRPLYRWYSQQRGNHYYSQNREGDKFTHGYVLEGPIGNIATSRLPGTRELYHWFNQETGMHFYTTDPKGENSAKAKYVYQGIVGYVR